MNKRLPGIVIDDCIIDGFSENLNDEVEQTERELDIIYSSISEDETLSFTVAQDGDETLYIVDAISDEKTGERLSLFLTDDDLSFLLNSINEYCDGPPEGQERILGMNGEWIDIKEEDVE